MAVGASAAGARSADAEGGGAAFGRSSTDIVGAVCRGATAVVCAEGVAVTIAGGGFTTESSPVGAFGEREIV